MPHAIILRYSIFCAPAWDPRAPPSKQDYIVTPGGGGRSRYPPSIGALLLLDSFRSYLVLDALLCVYGFWMFLDVSGRPLHSAKGRTRSAGTLKPQLTFSPDRKAAVTVADTLRPQK